VGAPTRSIDGARENAFESTEPRARVDDDDDDDDGRATDRARGVDEMYGDGATQFAGAGGYMAECVRARATRARASDG